MMWRTIVRGFLVAGGWVLLMGAGEAPAVFERSAVDSGVRVAVRVAPLEGKDLVEGRDIRVEIELSDLSSGQAGGEPLSGLFPAAWLDPQPRPARDCKERVRSFVGGSALLKPAINFNEYTVVALNQDASLTVVDPQFGFGGSQLLALVELRSPGADWAYVADSRRLFVSQPEAGAVAAVETVGWHVTTHIPTGPRPGRLLLQPDGAYLWVAFDGGVAVLLPGQLAERTRIATGRGPHDLAISADSRRVYVTNGGDGTVSVIDVASLAVTATVAVGGRPVSIDWCEHAAVAWVADAAGGLLALGGEPPTAGPRIATPPGLAQVRCRPGGRWALAVNPENDFLYVVDTAKGTLVQSGPVGDGPDQITFSDTLAYLRHRDSEEILMVPLESLGTPGAPLQVADFTGGAKPPGPAATGSALAGAPGAHAMLVANPADGAIYYYVEGMAAPVGSFGNYGHRPRAVLAVDRSLREQTPGRYVATARLAGPGRHDLAIYLESPRTVVCFDLDVAVDPEREALRQARPLDVAVEGGRDLRTQVGDELRLTLIARDGRTGAPKPGLADLEVQVMLAPGRWHHTYAPRELGEGRYELVFQVPEAGLYYLRARSDSAGLSLAQGPGLAQLIATNARNARD